MVSPLVQRITIETAFLPPIVIDQPLDGSPASPNPLMGLLKPKITVETSFRSPYIAAPYGDPGESRWPLVRNIALLALLATAGAIAWKSI